MVKKKYDPSGLFFVRHGVGSEDWSADGFTGWRAVKISSSRNSGKRSADPAIKSGL
jgi:bisphosphoglycerate-dependent phosphoglycerate mutase